MNVWQNSDEPVTDPHFGEVIGGKFRVLQLGNKEHMQITDARDTPLAILTTAGGRIRLVLKIFDRMDEEVTIPQNITKGQLAALLTAELGKPNTH